MLVGFRMSVSTELTQQIHVQCSVNVAHTAVNLLTWQIISQWIASVDTLLVTVKLISRSHQVFLQRSTLLAVHHCICHGRVRPSVCLSVCLSSVTFWCFVEMNEATIMRFSLSGMTIILVSGKVKIIWKFVGDHP